MLEDLLPLATESPACSDFARSLELRPPGSGLFLERAILVTVPAPWPKPALKHPALQAAAERLKSSSVKSRLFAAEPFSDTAQVEVYERHGAAAMRYSWQLGGAVDAEPLIKAIAHTPVGALDGVSTPQASLAESAPLGPTFLVCTQGTHDLCCGVSGVALADEIRDQRPDYTVRRVSHTGGHRFSPTFLAFPEGRMWAFADLELVDRIAQDRITRDDCLAHGRGWWGAKVGPTQVAESAVRAELATEPFVVPSIEEIDAAEGLSRFRISAGTRVFDVDVSVGRTVPSIACQMPGGLPAKPGREFAWKIEAVAAEAGGTRDGV